MNINGKYLLIKDQIRIEAAINLLGIAIKACLIASSRIQSSEGATMTAMELVTIRKLQILLTGSQTLSTNRNPIESKMKPIKIIRIDRSTPQLDAWSKIPTLHLPGPRMTSEEVTLAGPSEMSMKERPERHQGGRTTTQIACQVHQPQIPRRDMFPTAAVVLIGAAAEAAGDITETKEAVADSIGGSRSLSRILCWQQHPQSEGRRARQAKKERLRRRSQTND